MDRCRLRDEWMDAQTEMNGRTYKIGNCLNQLLEFLLLIQILIGQRLHHLLCTKSSIHLEREGGREGGREGRREGKREGRREGRREGKREGRREGRREGKREGRRKGRREGRREGGREREREGGREGERTKGVANVNFQHWLQ